MMKRDPKDIERAARIFKALSHPARLEIACRLSDGDSTQKDLLTEMTLAQSTMARHLSPLRETGLVVGTRQGPEVNLSIGSDIVRNLVESVCDWLHEDQTS